MCSIKCAFLRHTAYVFGAKMAAKQPRSKPRSKRGTAEQASQVIDFIGLRSKPRSNAELRSKPRKSLISFAEQEMRSCGASLLYRGGCSATPPGARPRYRNRRYTFENLLRHTKRRKQRPTFSECKMGRVFGHRSARRAKENKPGAPPDFYLNVFAPSYAFDHPSPPQQGRHYGGAGRRAQGAAVADQGAAVAAGLRV